VPAPIRRLGLRDGHLRRLWGQRLGLSQGTVSGSPGPAAAYGSNPHGMQGTGGLRGILEGPCFAVAKLIVPVF